MNRFLLLSGLSLAAALSFSTDARADEPAAPPGGDFFRTRDKDHDGRVSPAEFGGEAEVFRLLDRDGDGFVTPRDLGPPADFGGPKPGAGPGEPGAGGRGRGPGREPGAGDAPGARFRERIKAMDKDADGRISREEWQGRPEGFDRFDANKDGCIDAADLAAAGEGPAGRGPGPGGPGGPGPGGMGVPGGPGPMPEGARIERIFKDIDKNADGKVTAEEAPRPEMIALHDRNKDGTVDLEEFRATAREPLRRGAGLSADAMLRFDKDGDGKVSRSEFPGGDERFAQLDRDGDGSLTAADQAAGGPPGRGAGPRAGSGGPPAGAPGRPAPVDVAASDKDGNGRLSRNEFEGADDAWIRLDRNGDGWITPDEAGPGGAGPGPWFQEILGRDDADRDGRVSRAEWKGAEARFDALDRNHDGFVDARDARDAR